jgi:hypothetical protein
MFGTAARDDALAARRICDELFVMWSAARAEANDAYDDWCGNRGSEAYAVFLAAEERADAAERELASACRSLPVAV